MIQYELAETSLENEISIRKGPGNKYTPVECLKIMTDLAEGLSYIHSYKVFHLDIKTLNILKSFRGDYMLADFGQSMIFKSQMASRTCRGTPTYYSPQLYKAT